MWSTPSRPLLSNPLWPGLVVPIWILSIVEIELFNHLRTILIISYLNPCSCVQIIYITSEQLMNRITNVKNQYSKLSNKCYILIYMFMQHHNDTIITTQWQRRWKDKDARRTSLQIYLPLTLFVRFERVVQGLHVRGSWRPNINYNFLTPLSWPSRCVFLVL